MFHNTLFYCKGSGGVEEVQTTPKFVEPTIATTTEQALTKGKSWMELVIFLLFDNNSFKFIFQLSTACRVSLTCWTAVFCAWSRGQPWQSTITWPGHSAIVWWVQRMVLVLMLSTKSKISSMKPVQRMGLEDLVDDYVDLFIPIMVQMWSSNPEYFIKIPRDHPFSIFKSKSNPTSM